MSRFGDLMSGKAAEAPAPAPVAPPAVEPAPASAEDNGKKSADDILAMIRNRQS